ncbi:MAG: GTPase domain-containing protein [Acidobacteria bacterium]|nr:GTPase domain-containing protein [Acidobacteriota bacterium]MBU4254723.1 GTPase domain-containing protein [Acidobacteriota bacterium]MBU4331213.1 GTPase domain-containing protein [Acidobacteriota bacterium]MBU4493837.1 GTPase domain-containing protein [Acidobacteriota bacterium]
MPNINYVTKSLAIKIVYYGPGLSGKTTNLRYIYQHLNKDSRGEFLCMETPTERTLFFDLLPVKAGMIKEFTTHFHLMTVPGQVFYEASRRSVLKGADGIVFVADSQVPLLDANLENFDGLRKNLIEHSRDINLVPLVFQYNKRDLDNLIPVETFSSLFNSMGAPAVEASAVNGRGVFETLSEIAQLVVPKIREQIFWEKVQTDMGDERKRMEVAMSHESLVKQQRMSASNETVDKKLEMTRLKFKSLNDVEKEIDKLQEEFLSS